jgi:hypothetical protein
MSVYLFLSYLFLHPVLRIRDPVLFDPWIRDPESGMSKKPGSGSRMNIPNHISESLETVFWVKILKFFDADPYPESDIRNLFDPGSGIWDGKN